jgi:putative ABC transport system permease protein
MLRTHFFTAVRTLLKNRAVTLINVFGLAMSLTAFLFIIQYYLYENAYDAFFRGSEQIFRVNLTIDKNGQQIFKGAQTPRALYFFTRDQIPEVEANTITCFQSCVIKCNNQAFNAQPVLWVDEGFDKVFTLRFEQGKADLARPLTAIISSGKAKSLFGKENAIGKIIKVNEGMPVEITGVYAGLPANTHLKADYFISMKTFVHYGWLNATGDWAGNNWWNYLRLKPGSSPKAVEQQLDAIGAYKYFLHGRDEKARLSLQSLNDVHYLSGLTGELGAVTNKRTLYSLLIIGIFVVFFAWINLADLTAARAEKKKFEWGVKKILGATKWHLWLQSFFECLLINTVAFAIAFFIYRVLLGSFAQLFNLPLSDAYVPQTQLIWLLVIFFIAGILFSSLAGTFNIFRSGSSRSAAFSQMRRK